MGNPKAKDAGSFSVTKDKKEKKEKAPSTAIRLPKEAAKARTEDHKTHKLGRHLSRFPNWSPESQRSAKGFANPIPPTRILAARRIASDLSAKRARAAAALA